MVKKPQSFFYCGSFDHPDLQPIYDCNFFFLGLPKYNNLNTIFLVKFVIIHDPVSIILITVVVMWAGY